jgi:hypothetical protein
LNPYMPPRSESSGSSEASSRANSETPGGHPDPRSPSTPLRLFSPNQVVTAMLIGIPLVFSLLLATNYRRRGFSALAGLVLAFGVVTTAGTVLVTSTAMFAALGAVFIFSGWFYAFRDEAVFERNIAVGGAREGWGRWVLLCVATTLGVSGAMMLFEMLG